MPTKTETRARPPPGTRSPSARTRGVRDTSPWNISGKGQGAAAPAAEPAIDAGRGFADGDFTLGHLEVFRLRADPGDEAGADCPLTVSAVTVPGVTGPTSASPPRRWTTPLS